MGADNNIYNAWSYRPSAGHRVGTDRAGYYGDIYRTGI